MAEDWSQQEVALIVSDYFQMLAEEIAGRAYNKSQHRKALLPLLNNRSESSVEFKHQNISAVLVKLGLPYINGYKPASNYQRLLEHEVIEYIKANRQLEMIFQVFADTAPAITPEAISFETILQEQPKSEPMLREPEVEYESAFKSRSPVKVNYLEVEQANKLLGTAGEKIAYNYEKWRLMNEGKGSLADKIEWVSETQGDGLGYDIRSFNKNGTDRFIEVKSTKLTKEAPIFFTKNEFDFSLEQKSSFYLYRVFNIRNDPKIFIVNGAFDKFCKYEAVKFKGYF